MNLEEVLEKGSEVVSRIRRSQGSYPALAQAKEFIKIYAGPKSEFYKSLLGLENTSYGSPMKIGQSASIVEAFLDNLRSGLLQEISPERQAKLDVVSDFLEQAQGLLDDSSVHPAAPVTLIGASLEEFLRNWVEAEGLDTGTKKPSMDNYAKRLREAELITKQDMKDITSWGGMRNSAAHGQFEDVSDPGRVKLMLEGINLFMRKYQRQQ